MSIGHVVRISEGLQDPTNMYVQVKNGAIYRFKTPLATVGNRIALKMRIEGNGGQVQLKYWFCVRRSDGTSVPH